MAWGSITVQNTGSNGTGNTAFQPTANSGFITWIGDPLVINPISNVGIYQPEVRRTTKSVNITASLKGFNVTFYDAHGGAKSSEFSKDELTAALPDLLAKLTKEPKED